jgi:hypothetical protein
VATVRGESTAGPVIIAGPDMQRVRNCGGEAHNRVGKAYRTMIGTYIIRWTEHGRHPHAPGHTEPCDLFRPRALQRHAVSPTHPSRSAVDSTILGSVPGRWV